MTKLKIMYLREIWINKYGLWRNFMAQFQAKIDYYSQ